MQKFCTKCGKQLEENLPCACQQIEQGLEEEGNHTKTETNYVDANSSNVDLNRVVEKLGQGADAVLTTMLSFVKSPYKFVIKAAQRPNINMGAFFALFYALMTGLLGGIILKKIESSFRTSLGGFFNFSMRDIMGLSFGKVFWSLFFLIIVQVLALTIGYILFSKLLFKGKADANGVFTIVSMAKIPSIIASILAMILITMSYKIALVALIIASFIGVLLTYEGQKNASGVTGDNMIYLTVLSLSFMYFITYIYIKVIS